MVSGSSRTRYRRRRRRTWPRSRARSRAPDALVALVKENAKSGVFLNVLGVGTGNLNDSMLESITNHGNGVYSYIDSMKESERVLGEKLAGTMLTLAKDVKVQVFFNPRRVEGFRLIGYDNRTLAAEAFHNDKVDAGDLGAGHRVTAFYELVPAGSNVPGAEGKVDDNPFRKAGSTESNAWMRLRVRYKPRDGGDSVLVEQDVDSPAAKFDAASADFRFASAVAGFGMKLAKTSHADGWTWGAIEEIASSAVGADPKGERKELVELIRAARKLTKK